MVLALLFPGVVFYLECLLQLSVVKASVELFTPRGQRGQTAHFWSCCFFWRALFWIFFEEFLLVSLTVLFLQTNTSRVSLRTTSEQQHRDSCSTFISLVLFVRVFFAGWPLLLSPIQSSLAPRSWTFSSCFLFGSSWTSWNCFSMSVRLHRDVSLTQRLWWRESMGSSFWWICSVASWSSSSNPPLCSLYYIVRTL